MPLLAPTGTVITLFPAATTVPIDGNVEIIATVIENGVASAPNPTALHPNRNLHGHRHDGADGTDDDHHSRRRYTRSERHPGFLYDDDRTH